MRADESVRLPRTLSELAEVDVDDIGDGVDRDRPRDPEMVAHDEVSVIVRDHERHQ